MQAPRDILAQHDLRNPRHVVATGIANIWQVTRKDGTDAALKIYQDRDPRDEAPGFALLQAAQGRGVAEVFHFADGVALMEWLDGPSLADMAREGRDDAALSALIVCAIEMHVGFRTVDIPLPRAHDWFQTLFDLQYDPQLSSTITAQFQRCTALAHDLLQSQGPTQPLHGDFHHENLLAAPRGVCAFDAKGVMGEVAFEFASVFLNPLRAPELTENPARAHKIAYAWGAACGASPRRVLEWAAARAALSVAWDCKDHVLRPDHPRLDVPGHFLAALDSF